MVTAKFAIVMVVVAAVAAVGLIVWLYLDGD